MAPSSRGPNGTPLSDAALVDKLLTVMEQEVMPTTAKGVEKGNKVFGAAILDADFRVVVASTNHEAVCPFWHGEVHTLKEFFALPASSRPKQEDCYFLCTHAPCPMCLSALTWSGFKVLYQFFSYDDSEGTFNIPYDNQVLREVFQCKRPRRSTPYYDSYDLRELVQHGALSDDERASAWRRIRQIESEYDRLSEVYQQRKHLSTNIMLK
ncbi:unnamed protein product [Vitrella brassicaformis CCMP3155]|uniref:CMP/dCMP-type deaminase domain-containing protein n=1 Tax=Vitrella brassicaformis (strain CCMP3155) TaxID=1169540 RepID=A0A0G4EHR4_VITBC|nr:unnamed protein product [Vitrella brassicaformis CCMP3155]|eukprot:CEL95523.1 unnamed protein product [Vitrella brassicaformis CCMP3155]